MAAHRAGFSWNAVFFQEILGTEMCCTDANLCNARFSNTSGHFLNEDKAAVALGLAGAGTDPTKSILKIEDDDRPNKRGISGHNLVIIASTVSIFLLTCTALISYCSVRRQRLRQATQHPQVHQQQQRTESDVRSVMTIETHIEAGEYHHAGEATLPL
eukprot:scpid67110/ scgid17424/ 